MQFENLAVPSLIMFIVTSFILILGLDWRISLTALVVQYTGVFILIGAIWPLEMVLVKLITGWIATAILGMEVINLSIKDSVKESVRLGGRLFRLLLATLVGISILTFTPGIAKWFLQASYEQLLGGIFLISMGVLYLGFSDQPLRVGIGILTFLSGFEIIYATVDTSPLVTGFLSIITLGIALIISYLIAAPSIKEDV